MGQASRKKKLEHPPVPLTKNQLIMVDSAHKAYLGALLNFQKAEQAALKAREALGLLAAEFGKTLGIPVGKNDYLFDIEAGNRFIHSSTIPKEPTA
jgi:hypothetical protein